MSGNFGDKFLYFLAGAGVGGAIALLFAPQSGQDTRDEISKRALEGREFLDGKMEESRHFVKDGGRRVSKEVTSLVDRGKGEVSELVDRGKGEVSELVDRGKGEVGDLLDKGRDVLEKQKGQFSAAFEAGKEAYLQERKTTD
jgi:gas vesicle protein